MTTSERIAGRTMAPPRRTLPCYLITSGGKNCPVDWQPMAAPDTATLWLAFEKVTWRYSPRLIARWQLGQFMLRFFLVQKLLRDENSSTLSLASHSQGVFAPSYQLS